MDTLSFKEENTPIIFYRISQNFRKVVLETNRGNIALGQIYVNTSRPNAYIQQEAGKKILQTLDLQDLISITHWK